MTEKEVPKLVAVLMGAYPATRMANNTAVVYERMLIDLDYTTANAAIERLLATAKFMPTVAEIRETAIGLTSGDVRPGGDGWGDVLQSIGRYGIYRTPGVDFQFDDPVVADCVKSLGWEELCNSENQHADRARFIELYDRKAKTARQKQLSDSLPAMQRFRAIERSQQESRALPASESSESASPFARALANLVDGNDDVH